MAFQNITIQGNIGKIEPVTYNNNGNAVLKLSVAVSEKKGDQENTQWFFVKAYKGTAETIAKFFNIGDTILLNGKMNFYQYGDEGNKKYGSEMVAFTFSFCGKSSKQDSQQSQQDNQGFNQQPQNQQQNNQQQDFQSPPNNFQQTPDSNFIGGHTQQGFQGPPDDDIPF